MLRDASIPCLSTSLLQFMLKSLVGALQQTGFGRFSNCRLGRPMSNNITFSNLSISIFALFCLFGRFLKITLDRPLLCKSFFLNMFSSDLLNLQNVSKSLWIDPCRLKWTSEVPDIVAETIHRSKRVPDQIALDRPLPLQINVLRCSSRWKKHPRGWNRLAD